MVNNLKELEGSDLTLNRFRFLFFQFHAGTQISTRFQDRCNI